MRFFCHYVTMRVDRSKNGPRDPLVTEFAQLCYQLPNDNITLCGKTAIMHHYYGINSTEKKQCMIATVHVNSKTATGDKYYPVCCVL